MPSKYDEFWASHINQLQAMCNDARTSGYSQTLDLSDIVELGDRESWAGVAIVRGSRVLESRMAHANSLSKTWTNDKNLASNGTTFRLVIDNSPSLRVFRMNWRARRMQTDGKVLSSLSIPQVAIIEEIIYPMCERFSQNDNSTFNVNDLANWIKSTFPHIRPFTGDRGMKHFSSRYPESQIINLQDSCYHLSAPKSFWIEAMESGSRIQPLIRISKMVYRVAPDWQSRIPDSTPVLENVSEASLSLIRQYEVALPLRSQLKESDMEHRQTSKACGIVDYVNQATANRALGLAGEQFVVQIEQDKLINAGKPELANKVHHTSVEDGDGAGYDIQSFDDEGNEIFIEVKTTAKGQDEPFFITRNEIEFSKQLADKYWIYRVFEFDAKLDHGKLFRVSGAVDESFDLTPTLYSAKR